MKRKGKLVRTYRGREKKKWKDASENEKKVGISFHNRQQKRNKNTVTHISTQQSSISAKSRMRPNHDNGIATILNCPKRDRTIVSYHQGERVTKIPSGKSLSI